MIQNSRRQLKHIFGFFISLALTTSAPEALLASDSDLDRLRHADEETALESGNEITAVATLDYDPGSSYGYVAKYPKWNVTLTVRNPTEYELELGESVIVIDKRRESAQYIGCSFGRQRVADSRHLRDLKKRYDLDFGYNYTTEPDGRWSYAVCGKNGRCTVTMGTMRVYEDLGFGRVSPHSERTFDVEVICPTVWKNLKDRDYVAVVSPTIRALDHEEQRDAKAGTFRGLLEGFFKDDKTQERHGTSPTPYPRLFILKFPVGEAPPDDPIEPDSVEVVSLEAQPLNERAERIGAELWHRLFAINWLAENHPQSTQPVLIDVLKNNDQQPLLRATAADNLGHQQASAAVEPLIAAVEETDNAALRNRFLYALGDIGDPAAAAIIRKYLRDQDGQLTAIAAAGKVDDAEAVSTLISILNDNDSENTRRAAADALVQIGDEPAVTGLIAVLEDSESADRVLVARALANADAVAVVPPLATIARESTVPEELREQVIASLGTLGGADARATLEAILLKSETTEALRVDACRSLGMIGDAASVPVLSEVAQDAAAPERLREQVLTSLGTLGGTKARTTLEAILLASEPTAKLHMEACRSLGKIGDDASVPVLSKAVDSDDGDVSACALERLAAIGDAEVEGNIIAALSSPHQQTRSSAADELKKRGAQGSVTALWSAYRKETEQDTADSMAEALIDLQFSESDATPWLAERLVREGNKFWWEDIRLLRHLTGEDFGPDRKWADDDERDETIRKWQEWMIGEGLLERRDEGDER